MKKTKAQKRTEIAKRHAEIERQKPKPRKCLSCSKQFRPRSMGNWICPTCTDLHKSFNIRPVKISELERTHDDEEDPC